MQQIYALNEHNTYKTVHCIRIIVHILTAEYHC